MAKRFSRVAAPPKGDPQQVAQWRAVSELQKDVDTAMLPKRWAHLKLSADQAGVTATTLLAFDTVLKQRGKLSAGPTGLILLEPGYWRLRAGLSATHSAASTADFAWYLDPAGGNNILAQAGTIISVTVASHYSGGGLTTDPIAYVHAIKPTYVGLRCTSISSGTLTMTSSVSKALIEELDAWNAS